MIGRAGGGRGISTIIVSCVMKGGELWIHTSRVETLVDMFAIL